MSIWVLHQSLTPDEERSIMERTHLLLPFEGLPDLKPITNPHQAKQLLRKLYPGDPPETLDRRLERFWHQYHDMHVEDIIAVPLAACQQVVLAEVTGRYEYMVGENGSDIHRIPVKWYDKRHAMMAFGKHKEQFLPGDQKLFEVKQADARVKIRDKLPHKYNRFAAWKWLLIFFFLMNLLRFVIRIDQ